MAASRGAHRLVRPRVVVVLGGVGERQERVLQGGGLGPDVLGDEPGTVEREHHGGDEVARADDDEVGAVVLDGAHLGKSLEDLVGELVRCPEADPFRGRCLLAEVRGRTEGDDLAVVDERHPVAEPLGLLHEVGDEDDRDPAVADALRSVPTSLDAPQDRDPSSARPRSRSRAGR